MPYAIANFVYGATAPRSVIALIEAWIKAGDKRLEAVPPGWGEDRVDVYAALTHFGFEEHQSEGSGITTYIGVDVQPRRDECEDAMLVEAFVPAVSEAQEAQAKLDALDPELRALLNPVGLYVVWSSS